MFTPFDRLSRAANQKINRAVRFVTELEFRMGSMVAGRYVLRQKLGMGSYGVAYLCHDTEDRRPCVLKRVTPVRGGRKQAERIYAREVGMLKRLHHPAIPAFYEEFRHRNHLCFTMEYMEGTTLDLLLFQEQVVFSERQSLNLIKQLLTIVDYLHSVGIVHRDINIANVLLEGEHVKLIDFGLARELRTGQTDSLEAEELEEDDSPEKILRRQIRPAGDFYALGHLLLFLLYSGYNEKDQAEAVDKTSWENELALQSDTKKLIRRLLSTEQPFVSAQEIFKEIDQIHAAPQ